MVTDIRSRRWWLILAMSAMVAMLVAAPAAAAPGDEDDEGGNTTLRQQLDEANRGFLDAQAALEDSRKRQTELNRKLEETQKRLAALSESANGLAAAAYRNNNLRTASALLASVSPENFVDRATAVNTLASRNDKLLREYGRLNRELAAAKTGIDAEVVKQEQQLAEMAKRKSDAEKAVGPKTGGFATGSSKSAAPAPRRSNGTWPPESCSRDDPTTTGCLTPRTLHALQQGRAAGFTRHTSCFRPNGGGDHPRGRACDWAAQASGFGGDATGGDRDYGNRMAAYFVANAGRLGVIYVIWYRQIWQAATGWRAYSGRGSPSAAHTNHVHLSMY